MEHLAAPALPCLLVGVAQEGLVLQQLVGGLLWAGYVEEGGVAVEAGVPGQEDRARDGDLGVQGGGVRGVEPVAMMMMMIGRRPLWRTNVLLQAAGQCLQIATPLLQAGKQPNPLLLIHFITRPMEQDLA